VCAFTHVAAGPYATLQLAYLGAEVIKVETSTRIEYWRYRDRNNDPERSRPFADHNKNVRGVTLDLHVPGGVGLARALALKSNVVIDNFSAGVLDKLGLGYETLSAVRQDLIVVHMTGLGSTGPRSRYATFGPSLMAFCGMTHLWNHPAAQIPVGSQSSYPDFLAGAYAAYAIMAALHRRADTGKGRLIDLSQAQITAAAIGPSFVASLNQSSAAEPIGNVNPRAAPWGSYACRGGDDAWCVLAIESDAQWRAFVQAMGNPEWAQDAGLDTSAGRVERRAALDARVADWTRTRSPREVMDQCQAVGIPSGMVATGEDLVNDPHLAARGFLVELEHARLGRQRLPGSPVRFSRGRTDVWRFGPLLGEDNAYVFETILGLSAEEVAAGQESGAIR
jgi:benzylsuccinate CoA-transferase BbsF subunit